MGYGYGFKYVSVGEKYSKAQKYIKKMEKKGVHFNPVAPDTKLDTTWWGRAWNEAMEEDAYFSNRLSRGRSYIKNGFVLDIGIEAGCVKGLVAGSVATPYSVVIAIRQLSADEKKRITERCSERIDSLEDLLNGKIPQDLQKDFTELLFPSSKDFRMSCTCPDSVGVCKHVAAVMYAVSAMLDKDPLLFFTLRGFDYRTLIRSSVQQRTKKLLENAKKKSERSLDSDSVNRLFGIVI